MTAEEAKNVSLADFLEDLDLYVELVEERQRVYWSERTDFEVAFHDALYRLRSHYQTGALQSDDLKAAANETRKRVERLRALPGTKDEQRQFQYIASDLEFCAKRLESRISNAALQGATP